MEWATLFFAALGYLFGNILFAKVGAKMVGREEQLRTSKDGNPGAANAFIHGGFLCGVVALLGDLFKGFLPVWLFMRFGSGFTSPWTALVLAAPVLGHVFPIAHHMQGGKGITTTFGCLLALFPFCWEPLAFLAAAYLFLTIILCVSPHSHRTALAYFITMILLFLLKQPLSVCIGFSIIAAVVILKHHISKELRSEWKVKWLWTH